MNGKLRGFFSFAVMVVVLVVVLKVLDWLPAAVQKETIRQYSSVEEARAALGIEIYVPSYFPRSIAWPPARVLAQGRPFAAVVMEFREAGARETGLVIVQSASAGFRAGEKLRIARVNERVVHDLKGRRAELTVGLCKGGAPCSGISWDEGEFGISVTIKSPPFELLRIAESMVH